MSGLHRASLPAVLALVFACGGDSGVNTRMEEGGCVPPFAPGAIEMNCDGLTFDVSAPPVCESCGLIVDVHGFTMSAAMQDHNTNLRALGNARGYVVVQPNATPAPPSSSWTPGIDDAKIAAFVDNLLEAWPIDDARVHLTGFSQGGYMTWRLLCARPELWASVAPAAAGGECGRDLAEVCTELPDDSDTDVLYMHGRSDALVDFSCAEEQVAGVLESWGFEEGSEEVVEDADDYRRVRYQRAGRPTFEFLTHEYDGHPILRGHCYPGSTDPGGAMGQLFPFRCDGDNGFHWGEAALAFFERHPRGR